MLEDQTGYILSTVYSVTPLGVHFMFWLWNVQFDHHHYSRFQFYDIAMHDRISLLFMEALIVVEISFA